jgi:hypothetical protein
MRITYLANAMGNIQVYQQCLPQVMIFLRERDIPYHRKFKEQSRRKDI